MLQRFDNWGKREMRAGEIRKFLDTQETSFSETMAFKQNLN